MFCICNSNNRLYASSIGHTNLQQQDGLSFSSHAYCAHLFQDCDPAMKWAAQECESCPLEATIRRVTAALIKTSRGEVQRRRGGLTDLEALHLFLRHLIRKSRQSDKSPVRERLSERASDSRPFLPVLCVSSKFVLKQYWLLIGFWPPSFNSIGRRKYESYDEASIMYVIAYSFFLSGRPGPRLLEQILVLLQSNWNIHGHITP